MDVVVPLASLRFLRCAEGTTNAPQVGIKGVIGPLDTILFFQKVVDCPVGWLPFAGLLFLLLENPLKPRLNVFPADGFLSSLHVVKRLEPLKCCEHFSSTVEYC